MSGRNKIMDLKAFKKKLKSMSSVELKELMNKSNLTDLEYWLIKYAYIDERLVLNTCAKLNISESTYHRMLPMALIKIYYTLKFN